MELTPATIKELTTWHQPIQLDVPKYDGEFLCLMDNGYTKVCFWEGTKFISAELIEDRELEDKVLYWTDNPQLPNYETKDIKLDKPMISDEQYYREKEFEKKGFWNGVKITLMVVGILLALVFSLL